MDPAEKTPYNDFVLLLDEDGNVPPGIYEAFGGAAVFMNNLGYYMR